MRTLKTIVICAAFALGAETAHAGPYVGASILRAEAVDASKNVNDALNSFSGLVASQNVKFDDTALGGAIFGGIYLSPYIAAEVGYMYLGSYDFSGQFSAGGATINGAITDTVTALYAAGILRYDFNPSFGIFARGGIAQTQDSESCPNCSDAKTTGQSPLFGGGVIVKARDNMDMRIEFTQINDVGDNRQYTGGDFQSVAFSLIWNFDH